MKALVRNSDGVVIDISANEFPKMNVATWINCSEDVQIGWIYLENNFIDTNPTSEPVSAIDQLREQRNFLLAETDWWCVSDRTPTQEQIDYRQALRDMPANISPELDENGLLTNINWPEKPK